MRNEKNLDTRVGGYKPPGYCKRMKNGNEN
jgi:hypothetical protein